MIALRFMRQSNRSQILEAAVRVIHRDGVTGITFDSVAAEANVTRGGMMYHFPSREALLLAIHQQLADQWELSLASIAGKSAPDATVVERARAYADTAAHSANRAELLLLLDSSTGSDLNQPWEGVLDRWAAPAPKPGSDSAEIARFIARLASDGLWMYEAITKQPLSKRVRQIVVEQLKAIIDGSGASPSAPKRKPSPSRQKRT
jgi:AcrR family transcriptional regulator